MRDMCAIMFILYYM